MAFPGDCDDSDPSFNPAAPETCLDEEDLNCDGSVGLVDEDHDGFAACEECDDSDAAINPDATEVCDLADNDCDGTADEPDAQGAPTWYADLDGDGYGDPSSSVVACLAPASHVASKTDCDDSDAAIKPGATESCDGVDNDCDGQTDGPSSVDASTWYADADGDGHGDINSTTQDCTAPTGYVGTTDDCDDSDATVNPSATDDDCNQVDNDCDGSQDEDGVDTDGDGTLDCDDICPVYAKWSNTSGDGSQTDPYKSINDAIALRGAFCDDIVLLNGTYDETVDFGGADLTLRALNVGSVTLQAPSGGSVVTIASGESSDATLDGLKIKSGTGTTGDGIVLSSSTRHGGGLFVWESDPTITDCTIESNTVTGTGGGALFYDYEGLFEGNVVKDNEASEDGGGLALIASGGEFSSNTLEKNKANASGGSGGGIYVLEGAPTLDANLLKDNEAEDLGQGVLLHDSAGSFTNNIVESHDPVGLAIYGGDRSDIVNNTLLDNTTNLWASTDGATGKPLNAIVNNLIVKGDVGVYVYFTNFSTYTYNDVYDADNASYSGMTDPTGSLGNVSVDPSLNGDYEPGAAAVADGGTGVTSYGVTTDYDGDARPQGNGTSIGAQE